MASVTSDVGRRSPLGERRLEPRCRRDINHTARRVQFRSEGAPTVVTLYGQPVLLQWLARHHASNPIYAVQNTSSVAHWARPGHPPRPRSPANGCLLSSTGASQTSEFEFHSIFERFRARSSSRLRGTRLTQVSRSSSRGAPVGRKQPTRRETPKTGERRPSPHIT